MNDTQLQIIGAGHNIVVTDDGAEFRSDAERSAFEAHRGDEPEATTAAEWVEQICDWLHDDEPLALISVAGVIPPGHPLGVPATRPNGDPY